MSKQLIIFALTFLFSFPTLAGGLNSSFKGSNYSSMTRTSTVAEYYGDVTGANVLIDHSGENLLTDRTEFDDWTQIGTCAVMADVYRNPVDGILDADLLDNTSGANTDSRRLQYNTGVSLLGRTFTYSVWVRADYNHVASLQIYDGTASTIENFNVTNNWRRINTTRTCTSATNIVYTYAIPGERGVSTGLTYFYGASLIENDEYRTNMGTFLNPTDQSITKPVHDLANTNDPTTAYSDLQSSDGNRLPAREYDTTNYYLKAHHDSMNINDQDHTYTVYLNVTNFVASRYILSHGSWNADGLYLIAQSTGNIRAAYNSTGSSTVVNSPSTAINQWHIVQVVRKDNISTVYLNGVPGTPVDVTGEGIDGNRNFTVGASSGGGAPFLGKIGYIRVDAEALSIDELAADRERILSIATNWSRDNHWSFSRSTVATKQFSAGGANTLTPTLVEVPVNAVRVAGKGSGVLVEGQSQNVCHYSEEFDAAGTDWTNVRLSVINDSIITLNGAVTADTLHEDGTLAQTHYIQQNNTIPTTNGETYTASFYAKEINRNWVRSYITGDNDGGYFDLSNCTVGSTVGVSTLSTERLNDGWCRCIMTWTSSSTGNKSFIVYVGESDADVTFDGLNQDSFYLWGVQVEESPFPTSYIPTPTNAVVTRTSDSLVLDPHPANTNERILPELYAPNTPADALSVYMEIKCEFSSSADVGFSRSLISISGNTGTARWNQNRFWIDLSSAGLIGMRLYDNGSTQRYVTTNADPVVFDEWFTYRGFLDFTDLSRSMQWINGVEDISGGVGNMTGTATFSTVNTMIRIGQQYNGTVEGNCWIRNLRVNNREVTP